jgi:hypothetical protein
VKLAACEEVGEVLKTWVPLALGCYELLVRVGDFVSRTAGFI